MTYDWQGNVLTEADSNGNTSTGYSYDYNGNLVSESISSPSNYLYKAYSYDLLNRQTQANYSTVSTYRPDGLRFSKTVNGTTTQHIWDGANIVGDVVNGYVQSTYVRGINLVASKQSGSHKYYSYNGHGDVVQISNASGTVAWVYEYDAFGNQLEVSGYTGADANPFRYCGEYWDASSETYYLRRGIIALVWVGLLKRILIGMWAIPSMGIILLRSTNEKIHWS